MAGLCFLTFKKFRQDLSVKLDRQVYVDPTQSAAVANLVPFFNYGACTLSGAMVTPRAQFAACLLPDGKALFAGGFTSAGPSTGMLSSGETFDPVTGTFTATTGSMAAARITHNAVLLSNGKVLIAGGWNYAGGPAAPVATVELYDPAARTFSTTGAMTKGRDTFSVTGLINGKILLAGGSPTSSPTADNTAETYDSATAVCSATVGNMVTARQLHNACLLPDGTVLVAGGTDTPGNGIAHTETYNDGTRTFTASGDMATARAEHTMTLLPNGLVLVAGGCTAFAETVCLASCELYNPATRTFSATGSLSVARRAHDAVLLPDGTVAVFGGAINALTATGVVEIYNPTTGTWSVAGGSLLSARIWAASILLNNGNVLIAGGTPWPTNGEIYSKITAPFTPQTTSLAHKLGAVAPSDLLNLAFTCASLVAGTGSLQSGCIADLQGNIAIGTGTRSASGLVQLPNGAAINARYSDNSQDSRIIGYGVTVANTIEVGGSARTGVLIAGSATKLGFFGTTPIARAVLATGTSKTVDNVITALQNLGLVSQS
jgi:hypothetical protein